MGGRLLLSRKNPYVCSDLRQLLHGHPLEQHLNAEEGFLAIAIAFPDRTSEELDELTSKGSAAIAKWPHRKNTTVAAILEIPEECCTLSLVSVALLERVGRKTLRLASGRYEYGGFWYQNERSQWKFIYRASDPLTHRRVHEQ